MDGLRLAKYVSKDDSQNNPFVRMYSKHTGLINPLRFVLPFVLTRKLEALFVVGACQETRTEV